MTTPSQPDSAAERPDPLQVRFVSAIAQPELDNLGFLDLGKATVSPAATLLGGTPAIVVAPPLRGKSHIARALRYSLQQDVAPTARVPMFTSLDQDADLLPDPWEGWRRSQDLGTWIIDSLDEGLRRRPDLPAQLEQALESLKPSEQVRLHWVVFCRESAIPPGLHDRLAHAWRAPVRFLHLAPIDRGFAEAWCTDRGLSFERVVRSVLDSKLQPFVGEPEMLHAIANLPAASKERVTGAEVWRSLLVEQLRTVDGGAAVQVDAQLELVARCAAVLALSGTSEVADVGPSSHPAIPDIIPLGGRHHGEAMDHRRLLDQGLHAFTRRTPTGRAFARASHSDFLAAWGLRDLPLPRVRSLLCDSSGHLAPPLLEIARCLFRIAKSPDVKSWLLTMFGGDPPLSDWLPPESGDLGRVLDRLEAATARTSRRVIRSEDPLDRLRAPGLAAAVVERLGRTDLEPTAYALHLELATRFQIAAAAAPALALLERTELPGPVRLDAAELVASFGREDQVAVLWEHATRPGRAEDDVTAMCLLGVMRRGLRTVVEVARVAPRRAEHLIDHRVLLKFELVEKLNVESARALLRDRVGESHRSVEDELLERAVKLLLAHEPLAEEDVRLVLSAYPVLPFEAQQAARSLAVAVSLRPELRRRAFEIVRTEVQGDELLAYSRGYLNPEDLDWLLDSWRSGRIPRAAAHDLGQVALRLADAAAEPARSSARAAVESLDPGLLERWDAGRREMEELASQPRPAPKIPLQKVIDEILGGAPVPADRALWHLTRACFDEPAATGYRNVDGRFDALPSEVQERVLDFLETSLMAVAPTTIPSGDTFPATIRWEALAFSALLFRRPTGEWLTADAVGRWLPAALRAAFENRTELLARCYARHSTVTESTLLATALREAQQANPALFALRGAPSEMWTEAFGRRVVALADNAALVPAIRAPVLRLVVVRTPEVAVELARAWTAADGKLHAALESAALDVLLMREGPAVLARLLSAASRRGDDALLQSEALRGESGLRVEWRTWSPADLMTLLDQLYRSFPPSGDPDRSEGAYWVSPEIDLRHLRGYLVEQLLERDGCGDVDGEVIGRLEHLEPAVAELRQARASRRDIAAALGDPAAPRNGALAWTPPSVAQVAKALDSEDFRILRSAEDLSAALRELMTAIAHDAEEWSLLLWDPRHGTEPKRAHEKALCLYLAVRLRDRLPRVVAHREVEFAFQERSDIHVSAASTGGELVHVVVEAKWSNNSAVWTALESQLGDSYLARARYRHGIYLVAWTGTCPAPPDARNAKPTRPAELESALLRQAASWGAAHPGFTILPIVLDFSYKGGRR